MHKIMPRIGFAVALGGVAAASVAGGVGYASGHGGGGGTVCTVPSRYPTIQAAVDATACSTIRVAPGNYPENVTIARSLRLDGAKAGQDARTRRSTGESTIIGGSAATVTITADNVTIDGFTLNGPPGAGTAALVMPGGNSGETVQNTVVDNPGRAASITTSRTTFRANLVRNTSTATDGLQANSTPVHDVTMTANSFGGANPAIYNADMTFIEGNANITVADNRSSGDGTLVALFKTTGARISGNTVAGAANSSAIYLGGGNSKVTVTGNTINAAGTGVKVANAFGIGPNSAVGISRNTLRRNQYGVSVGAAATSGPVLVNRNSLTGNTLYGVVNDPVSGAPVDATCNWWGSLSGPGPVGPGKGDKVSAGVTYRPWPKLSSLIVGCR